MGNDDDDGADAIIDNEHSLFCVHFTAHFSITA